MILLLLFIMLLNAQSTPGVDAVYAEARRYDRSHFHYDPSSAVRQQAVTELVGSVAVAAADGRAPAPEPAKTKSGLELIRAHDNAGPLWVLREPAGQRDGAGLFVFRTGSRSSLCLQAPHTFFDEGTGEIALALFEKLQARCLFVNTVHRYAPASKGTTNTVEHPADVAHAPDTLFEAATRGLLAAEKKLVIIQVHGFGKRPDLPAGAKAVISDGTATPHPLGAGKLHAALAKRAGAGVLLFGRDTKVLGATTNQQGIAARAAGASFFHIEMSAPFRKALRSAGATVLADALLEALEKKP